MRVNSELEAQAGISEDRSAGSCLREIPFIDTIDQLSRNASLLRTIRTPEFGSNLFAELREGLPLVADPPRIASRNV